MKKLLVLALALVFICSCANTSFLCRNKTTIDNTLNGIIAAANALIIVLPQGSPIIAQVQATIQVAQAALAKACPTDLDVQMAQARLTTAMQDVQAGGFRLKR